MMDLKESCPCKTKSMQSRLLIFLTYIVFITADSQTAQNFSHVTSQPVLKFNATAVNLTISPSLNSSTHLDQEDSWTSHTKSDFLTSKTLLGQEDVDHTIDAFPLIDKEAVNLSSKEIASCLLSSETLQIAASEVLLFYNQSNVRPLTNNSEPTNTKYVCILQLSAMSARKMHVKLEHQDCTQGNWVELRGSCADLTVPVSSLNKTWNGCESMHKLAAKFYTSHDIFLVEIHVKNVTSPYALQMSVSEVISVPKDLELVMISETEGYVQTPGWNPDDPNHSYPLGMDSWVKVTIPGEYCVMMSFLFLNSGCPDEVEIYVGGRDYGDRKFRDCGALAPRPEVFCDSEFHVHFISEDRNFFYGWNPGFRLLFSFHEASQAPKRLKDSEVWNCSAPNFEEFKHHLHCNGHVQCQLGEDERGCPWELCGPGELPEGVLVGGRCYVFYRVTTKISYRNSRLKCLSLGGNLVSINTLEEWHDVVNTFLKGRPMLLVIGLKSASPLLPQMDAMQWEDTSIDYLHVAQPELLGAPPLCAVLDQHLEVTIAGCERVEPANVLCEMPSDWLSEEQKKKADHKPAAVILSPLTEPKFPISVVVCPAGHYTHAFLACDALSACWADQHVVYGTSRESWDIPASYSCPAPLTSLPPSFPCETGGQRVPYTLVCDHRADCEDSSDESFCVFEPCQINAPLRCGNSRQCHSEQDWCDGQNNCVNGADEAECDLLRVTKGTAAPPPAVIQFKPGRRFSFEAIGDRDNRHSYKTMPFGERNGQFVVGSSPGNEWSHHAVMCPPTHFLCASSGYCLPVYVRCNGVIDCPNREDEMDCARYVCPGFYRCRASSMCVHPDHICDNTFHCPQQDDEIGCVRNTKATRRIDHSCPTVCTCLGMAFICPKFDFEFFYVYSRLRYLDASGSGLQMKHISDLKGLVHLSLEGCNITQMFNITFPNMRSLDLSHNRIHVVHAKHLKSLPNLKALFLSGNPLLQLWNLFGLSASSTQLSGNCCGDDWQKGVPGLDTSDIPLIQTLDLSEIRISVLSKDITINLSYLQSLNLSGCGLEEVLPGTFGQMSNLRLLDIRGCPLKIFPREIFRHMYRLQDVYADNYKLCCPANLPEGFNVNRCLSPFDEISSCEALLRSNVYRVFLSVFSFLSVLGNLGSFLVRVCVQRTGSSSSFNVFVTQLSVADFLMGVYLAIIGVADLTYRGTYLWEDVKWRQSTGCKMAGFLSFLSSEVSAIIIFLITLDRFLVLRFPLSQLHFRTLSAKVASCVAWALGVVMASLPFLPLAGHWQFYSQTGICIPLPITRTNIPGSQYSFAVMVVLNFLLFLLIAAGQASIYASVRLNSMAPADTGSSSRRQDRTVARRLISVAMSDFLCWFPIGLLGMLASQGVPVPGEVNVGLAIFVLPLNSAMNPFLYTFNMILERRRQIREERLLKLLSSAWNPTNRTKETNLPR